MDPTLQTAAAAVLGFLAKSLWDWYWKRREEIESLARSKRLDILERQLSLFYWPLYLHLQKNNVIWDHLVRGTAIDSDLKEQVDSRLYASFFLPNHEEMIRIIETNAYLAQPEGDFGEVLLRFIRHVTIFKAIKSAGLPYDPIAVGEPWPVEFFGAVETRLKNLQREYDHELNRSAA